MNGTEPRDYMRYFPKKKCYSNQVKAMDAISEALSKRKLVLFEGACGTGKTLSALAPGLSVAEKENKKLIIATSVHQQMLQFIQEARDIQKQKHLNVIVLKSKKYMCPRTIGQIEGSTETEENTDDRNTDKFYDACESLKENTDEFYKEFRESEFEDIIQYLRVWQTQKENRKKEICREYLDTLTADKINRFRPWLFSEIRTPEDIAAWSKKYDTCGYEYIKECLCDTELLICNYRHLLDYDIYRRIQKMLNRDTDQIIAILDEAHNIESKSREYLTDHLTENSVENALSEIRNREYNRQMQADTLKTMEQFLTILLGSIQAIYNARLREGERKMVGYDWHDIRIADPDIPANERTDIFLKHFTTALEKENVADVVSVLKSLKAYGILVRHQKKSSSCFRVAKFIDKYMNYSSDAGYYPVMSVAKNKLKNDRIYGRIEIFRIFPSIEYFLNSIYSGVLMSATLEPFKTLIKVLGISRDVYELSMPMTFPKDNRLTLSVLSRPLFAKERDSPETVQYIKTILEEIIEASIGNILVFFQNYREALRYGKILKCSVPIFLNQTGTSSRESQEIMNNYFRIGESGNKSVLLTYMWGSFTEGVDYKDERARTVVIVGVGYPHTDDRWRAVESAYNSAFGNGWELAITMPTVRKVRQAMGRVIRSPEDYGVRVLIDGRYTIKQAKTLGKYSVFNIFPGEERAEFIDISPENVSQTIRQFFNKFKKDNI